MGSEMCIRDREKAATMWRPALYSRQPPAPPTDAPFGGSSSSAGGKSKAAKAGRKAEKKRKREAAASAAPAAPGSVHAGLSAGWRLVVDGKKAKVKKLGVKAGRVRVRFSESKELLWLKLPADCGRVSRVRPPKA